MRFKKTIAAVIIITSVWVGGYFWNKQKKVEEEAILKAKMAYTVEKWDIRTEVKVTATAKLADEQNLSFGQEWKISKVYVRVWDEVKAWDILAELSLDDYDNAVKTAQIDLENARLWLTKLLNNDTSVRESQLRMQISEAKTNYEVEKEQESILKRQLDVELQKKNDLLQQKLRDYRIAQKDLEVAKSDIEVNTELETEKTETTLNARKKTIDSVVNSLNSSLWDAEYVVESVDEIFWVSPAFQYKNDDYDIYLWAKDSGLKKKTKSEVTSVYNFIKEYKEKFSSLDSSYSDSQIKELIEEYYQDSTILVELIDDALDSVDMSIEASWKLSSTDISTFKTSLETSRTKALAVRTNLETLSNSINSLLSQSVVENQLELSVEQKKLSYETKQSALRKQAEDLVSLTKEIANLEKDNFNSLQRKKTQNENLLENIKVLEKELTDLLDGADKYDIQQQNNLIKQAQLKVERTIDQKDDYQIIAEFNWRVRDIDIVEWEQYKLDDRKYIVIENPNLIELELQIGQIDIVKIQKWDPVVITFDSYPNNPIESAISKRNVNPQPNGRWGYYYEAKVLLEPQDLEILAGMSALVTITTDEANDVLIIPSLALVQENWYKFVYLKDGEEYKRRDVKTGVINNFHVEVSEWLKEWDVIKSSVLDDEVLKEMWIDDWSSNPFGKTDMN